MTACITIKDYKLFKRLGKGSFGEVFLTSKDNSSVLFATKRINLKQQTNKNMIKYLNYELSIMKELYHPNIIRLIEYIPTNNHIYVIMDYCNGGNLTECLKKYGKPFPVEIIQYFMRQIVGALKYIHSRRIIHRDIKLDNILINFRNEQDKINNNLLASEIKIIDFGLATRLGSDGYAYTFIGSPINMDPKILGGVNEDGKFENLQGYNEKADIWSLGTICYQMLTGQALYKVDNFKELLQKVKVGNYFIPINMELSNEIVSFLNSMLQYEGEYRASAEQLLNHPFLVKDVKDFTKLDLNKISNKIYGDKINMNPMKNSTVAMVVNEKSNSNFQSNIFLNRNMSQQIIGSSNINQNNNKVRLRPTLHLENNKSRNINNLYQKEKPNGCKTMKNINIRATFQNDSKLNEINGKMENKDKENELNELERVEKMLIELEENERERNEIKRRQNARRAINSQNEINILGNNNENDWNKYINGLLTEYLEAKDYFQKNNLIAQEKDANNKCIDIQKKIHQLESGNSLIDIPPPVSPEYIYGYSTNERQIKFKELINNYIKEKNKIEIGMKNCEKYAINDSVKQEMETGKLKLEKINNIIKRLENLYNNIWVPAPEYVKESKKYQVEKTSYINCDFNLKIQLKKIDNIFTNMNLLLFFKISESKNLTRPININSSSFYDEWIWTLNFNEWRNIDNNVDTYILGINIDKSYLSKNALNNNFIFDITKAINGTAFSFNITIPMANENKTTFNINIIPILPEMKKYLANEIKKCLVIKYVYPAFDGKSMSTNKIPNFSLVNP